MKKRRYSEELIIGAMVDKGTGSVGRGNVAGDHLHLGIAWHVARFAVSRCQCAQGPQQQ